MLDLSAIECALGLYLSLRRSVRGFECLNVLYFVPVFCLLYPGTKRRKKSGEEEEEEDDDEASLV